MSSPVPPPPLEAKAPADPMIAMQASLDRIEAHTKAARSYLGILVLVFVVLPILFAVYLALQDA